MARDIIIEAPHRVRTRGKKGVHANYKERSSHRKGSTPHAKAISHSRGPVAGSKAK